MPTLFLIPAPIGDFVYPINWPQLKLMVVENGKDARKALKQMVPDILLQEIEWIEIDRTKLDVMELRRAIQEAFRKGSDVGLMSDAGVPCVADPGSAVVKLAHQTGFRVKPLVGPSSLLLALMASGFNGQSFAFNGYLSTDEAKQIKEIKRLEEESAKRNITQLFIETPYRNNRLLQTLIQQLHPDTGLCVACDLTSETEEIISLKISDWKKKSGFDFHKRPVVFLIYAGD